MHGVHPIDDEARADLFVQDQPVQLQTARAYFLAKNLQAWGAPIRLHPWDTWDKLADRLDTRLGYHIWHPWHWQEVARRPDGRLILRVME